MFHLDLHTRQGQIRCASSKVPIWTEAISADNGLIDLPSQ